MRRAPLILFLPLLLLLITEVATQIGQHSEPPVRGDIYWTSTPELTVAGLNAPAELVSITCFKLLPGSTGRASGHIIYLLFVVVLWALVGWYLDSVRASNGEKQQRARKHIVPNVLAILLGAYLLVTITLHNVIFTSPRDGTGGGSNFAGDVVRQTLTLIWSLLLMIIPVWSLVRTGNTQPSRV